MSTIAKKSLNDLMLDGLEEWRKQHPEKTRWDNEDVVQWLMDERGYGLERRIAKKELVKRLSKAQNRKKVRNKQHRLVREYHSARLEVPSGKGKMVQKTLWSHRSELDASFAHTSMDQRQKQAEGFCRSMYNDSQDLNDNNENLKGNPIQLELDFTYVSTEKPKQKVQIVPTDESFDSKKQAKKRPR